MIPANPEIFLPLAQPYTGWNSMRWTLREAGG